jgi:hypothetical protein
MDSQQPALGGPVVASGGGNSSRSSGAGRPSRLPASSPSSAGGVVAGASVVASPGPDAEEEEASPLHSARPLERASGAFTRRKWWVARSLALELGGVTSVFRPHRWRRREGCVGVGEDCTKSCSTAWGAVMLVCECVRCARGDSVPLSREDDGRWLLC